MNIDFKSGDVVRHKSGGKDITIIRLEDESVAVLLKTIMWLLPDPRIEKALGQ